ncbi:putative transcriptional regulator [Azospirillum agricola]|uniref:YqgE/AlgH family protein n=1 Tax=Azospirillum agricola TaxID=1720247 RepID=UPI001AE97CFE|nr:YqgE/AlgH family protein [Azospirillum agricola]MBP2227421.1 putative transcriptional regulator [Azospirillum agricola]
MPRLTKSSESLTGQLLIAMPGMEDPRFQRTVIYMCAHSEEGAMGLVINRLFGSITFEDLLEQLDMEVSQPVNNLPVHYGGPVESGRGFVLHSTDYVRDGTLVVNDDVALTATIDILRAISEDRGPRRNLLLLGYAGWGPGQLDAEFQANGWLNVPCDEELLFDTDLEAKWERSIAKLGVSVSMLSGEAGHA